MPPSNAFAELSPLQSFLNLLDIPYRVRSRGHLWSFHAGRFIPGVADALIHSQLIRNYRRRKSHASKLLALWPRCIHGIDYGQEEYWRLLHTAVPHTTALRHPDTPTARSHRIYAKKYSTEQSRDFKLEVLPRVLPALCATLEAADAASAASAISRPLSMSIALVSSYSMLGLSM